MSLFQNQHLYSHSFESVATVFWRKYPNPHSHHIKEIDVFHRHFNPETGDLTVHRLISVSHPLPAWLTAFGIPNCCYAVEKTTVNNKTRTMVSHTRNVTGSTFIKFEETCTYRPSPLDLSCTEFTHKAQVTAQNLLRMFAGRIESYGVQAIADKAKHGVMIMETLCQHFRTVGLSGLLREPSLSLNRLNAFPIAMSTPLATTLESVLAASKFAPSAGVSATK